MTLIKSNFILCYGLLFRLLTIRYSGLVVESLSIYYIRWGSFASKKFLFMIIISSERSKAAVQQFNGGNYTHPFQTCSIHSRYLELCVNIYRHMPKQVDKKNRKAVDKLNRQEDTNEDVVNIQKGWRLNHHIAWNPSFCWLTAIIWGCQS